MFKKLNPSHSFNLFLTAFVTMQLNFGEGQQLNKNEIAETMETNTEHA